MASLRRRSGSSNPSRSRPMRTPTSHCSASVSGAARWNRGCACAHADDRHAWFGLCLGNAMLSMLVKVRGDLARVEGVRQNARVGCLLLEHHGERLQEGRVAGRGAGPVAQNDVARCEARRVHVPLRAAELWERPRLEDGEGGACACSSVWVCGEEVDVLNALMNMYAKCVYVVAACKVFDSMAVMDFISWSAMIPGHFENGDCNTGLKLFLTMLQDEIQPNLRKLWDGSGGKAWDNYCWRIRGSHAESLRGEEDSEFADPAGSFRGLPRFKQNRTNFGSLLEKLNMKLTKCALSFILLSVYADLSLHNQDNMLRDLVSGSSSIL